LFRRRDEKLNEIPFGHSRYARGGPSFPWERIHGLGAVDALKFSAAMRVFAEWRLLRQVPEGYKGFAIGMSLGHKELLVGL
jgi:hypothetical protein